MRRLWQNLCGTKWRAGLIEHVHPFRYQQSSDPDRQRRQHERRWRLHPRNHPHRRRGSGILLIFIGLGLALMLGYGQGRGVHGYTIGGFVALIGIAQLIIGTLDRRALQNSGRSRLDSNPPAM